MYNLQRVSSLTFRDVGFFLFEFLVFRHLVELVNVVEDNTCVVLTLVVP